jgi:cytochrome c oxidase assembly protein subunit 15
MLAEHSHRLLGMFVGIVTLTMMLLVLRTDSRGWVRWLAVAAFVAVLLQGVLGGLRVEMRSNSLAMIPRRVRTGHRLRFRDAVHRYERLVGAFHARTGGPAFRTQVARAGLRHRRRDLHPVAAGSADAPTGTFGLAIPTFPLPLLPEGWSHATGIAWLHRVLALLIFIDVTLYTRKALGAGAPRNPAFRSLVSARFLLLFVQIGLGALSIWWHLQPLVVTLHVVNGSLLLVLSWSIVFLLYRGRLVSDRRPCWPSLAAAGPERPPLTDIPRET